MAGTDVIERRSSDVGCKMNYVNPGVIKSNTMDGGTTAPKVPATADSTHSSSNSSNARHYHHHRGSVSSSRNNTGNSHSSMHHTGNGVTHTPKRTGRGRQRTNSLPKSSGKGNPYREITCPEEAEMKSGEIALLPPIGGHHNGHAPGPKSDPLSPRNFPYSNGHSHPPSNHNGVSRMAVLGTTSPDGATIYKNSHLSEPVFEGHPKTPPITSQGLINTSCNAPQANSGVRSSMANHSVHMTSNSPEPMKTSDSPRLSPVNATDKPKVKFEKKVLKTLAENNIMPLSPSPRGNKLSNPADAATPVPPTRDSKTKPRRSSSQSLPKLATPEEPFSIRRKIEQFRKWHEEQYTDKLKRLKLDGDSRNQMSEKRPEESVPAPGIDFAKILEDTIVQSRGIDSGSKTDRKDINDNNCVDTRKGRENGNRRREMTSTSANVRPMSGATWKTWRDINQSDAYNDVKKYIRDNDLMDAEREEWIKMWITEVHSAMEQMAEEFVEVAI